MHGVDHPKHETVIIRKAAERLGISEQAVRQRIRRKTLPAQRLDGKLYVVLSAGDDAPSPSPTGDGDAVASAVRDAYSEVVTQLRRENELLRAQLSVKDEQLRANQVLMSQLIQQRQELPAVLSTTPEQSTQEPTGPVPAPDRPWWKFWTTS